jgi:glycosyltransferase involved in cell wall biosynthesis
LETGIGGSEEKLIEWARELAPDYDITIFHNGDHGVFDGVKYMDFREFKGWQYSDIFISFKARQLLTQTINSPKKLHWTSDIEDWEPFLAKKVDKILTISDWHRSRMSPDGIPTETLYLWADLERLDRNKIGKEKGTMLYSTSFDRGLEELLRNWGKVKKELDLKKLYITYGWDFLDRLIKGNPGMQTWKRQMVEMMKQDGIELLGRLSNDEMCKMYWKSEYWCLPSNNPDGELFCINAVKAQYCGCKPVVRRIGGLQETVNQCIDFDELIGKGASMSSLCDDWKDGNILYVVDNFDMKKQIQKWKEILG